MDNITLKKKLSSYITDGGYLKNVSDELLYEILVAWENWTGSNSEFYKCLGFTYNQMASVIGKAKKMKREGYFGESDFKQIQVEVPVSIDANQSCIGIEIIWNEGKIIRFSRVELLIDFLKKVA
jgi:hypothetical protein